MTRSRRHNPDARKRAFAAGVAGSLGLFTVAVALGDEAVFVTGVNHDLGERLLQQGNQPFTLDDICREAPRLGPQLKLMVDHMDQAAVEAGSPITLSRIQAIPGAPSRYEIERDVGVATEEFCNSRETAGYYEPFVISYTSCRMTMLTPTNSMVINMPAGGQTARMYAADHTTNEVTYVDLNVDLNAVADYVGSGWAQSIDMVPQGSTGQHIGYDTELYTFNVSSGLGNDGQGGINDVSSVTSAQSFGSMVSVTSEGSAWVARDVPGYDVVRSFYENLTTSVQLGENSMFSGMIKNMVGMLREGMPLFTEQTMTSKVMGREMAAGSMRSVVTNIRVRDLSWSECEPLPIPDNYNSTDLNQQMSEAMGSGSTSDEMAAAMQEYEQAMQGMSEEDRQRFEQMGMGNMMQQIMGGANPGAPGAAPGALVEAGANSGSGSNMPPADKLQGSSMAETVQLHLQALGYDVGAVDGEMSMQTVIAISTFQAEKGLEVSGEVSPQLLGVLSAEVDRRR